MRFRSFGRKIQNTGPFSQYVFIQPNKVKVSSSPNTFMALVLSSQHWRAGEGFLDGNRAQSLGKVAVLIILLFPVQS